jgi:hypothetical protein
VQAIQNNIRGAFNHTSDIGVLDTQNKNAVIMPSKDPVK